MITKLGEQSDVVALCKAAPVVVADVGARRESGARWMAQFPAVEILAFDPDPEECGRIEARFAALPPSAHHLRAFPVALSDVDGRETLYITAKPDCCSLFKPNREMLGHFADLERFDVLREEAVSVKRLDSLRREGRLPPIDLLKLDVQGAELKVLKGAQECLADCLALEIEVEFSELYEGQALFADVDSFVRAAGFSLFDIRPQRWTRKCEAPTDPYERGRQLIWGDAIYLRDFKSIPPQAAGGAPVRMLKLALMAEQYGHRDYAREILADAQGRPGGAAPWLRECADILAAAAQSATSGSRPSRTPWQVVKRAVRKFFPTET